MFSLFNSYIDRLYYLLFKKEERIKVYLPDIITEEQYTQAGEYQAYYELMTSPPYRKVTINEVESYECDLTIKFYKKVA